jgi:hypothetical protein
VIAVVPAVCVAAHYCFDSKATGRLEDLAVSDFAEDCFGGTRVDLVQGGDDVSILLLLGRSAEGESLIYAATPLL